MVSNPDEGIIALDFAWQPRIEGEIAHVEEFVNGVHQKTYGPMAAPLVEQFILECKQSLMSTFIRLYGEIDGKDPTQENQS